MSHTEIVVDTSALMAILQEEPEARFCRRAIREAEAITMSDVVTRSSPAPQPARLQKRWSSPSSAVFGTACSN